MAAQYVNVRFPVAMANAVIAVLNERIAGGADDLRDALGITSHREAREMFERIEKAVARIESAKSPQGRISNNAVVVSFTHKEAENVAHAAENSIGNGTDEQDRAAVLGDAQSVRAGQRGLEKLWRAISGSDASITYEEKIETGGATGTHG